MTSNSSVNRTSNSVLSLQGSTLSPAGYLER